jgi:hypothetical protein
MVRNANTNSARETWKTWSTLQTALQTQKRLINFLKKTAEQRNNASVTKI